MNGAYPPGVTGYEPEIIGREEIEWDLDSFEESGMLDDYTEEGMVYGYRGNVRFTALAMKCLGIVEVDYATEEFDTVLED